MLTWYNKSVYKVKEILVILSVRKWAVFISCDWRSVFTILTPTSADNLSLPCCIHKMLLLCCQTACVLQFQWSHSSSFTFFWLTLTWTKWSRVRHEQVGTQVWAQWSFHEAQQGNFIPDWRLAAHCSALKSGGECCYSCLYLIPLEAIMSVWFLSKYFCVI